LKVIDQAKTKLRGYQSMLEKKIGFGPQISVDWDKWSRHPAFLKRPVSQQTEINETMLGKNINELLNGKHGLCEIYTRANSEIQGVMKRKIKKIVFSYDPTDNINEKTAVTESYTCHSAWKAAQPAPAPAPAKNRREAQLYVFPFRSFSWCLGFLPRAHFSLEAFFFLFWLETHVFSLVLITSVSKQDVKKNELKLIQYISSKYS
jgi:hypothetical protein